MFVLKNWLPSPMPRIGFCDDKKEFPPGYHDSEGLFLAAHGNLSGHLYFRPLHPPLSLEYGTGRVAVVRTGRWLITIRRGQVPWRSE
jgi:hypothetical protein